MAKAAPFVTEKDKERFWHSTSHILADAVKRLWPDVKLGIGPAIADGFYYDFDKKEPFTAEDLAKIEQLMKKIVKEDKFFRFMQPCCSQHKGVGPCVPVTDQLHDVSSILS